MYAPGEINSALAVTGAITELPRFGRRNGGMAGFFSAWAATRKADNEQ
jgi:hypothetical protein